MEHLFKIDEASCTVVLNNRSAIGDVMESTGVTTLDGFNKVAVLIVKQFGHAHNVSFDETTEKEWSLGAQTEADAQYLRGFLAGDVSEIVNLNMVV